MKKVITVFFICLTTSVWAQKTQDLFLSNDVRVNWLGIDFSHVKLIGDFSHFAGIGEKSSSQVKNRYFASWNRLILNERDKYDIKGMLHRDEIFYDLGLVDSLNATTPTCDLESYNNPNYTLEDVTKFVGAYDVKGKTGIGVIFIAESLNKAENEAYYHFVAINLSTKEILLHERLRGEPGGFGIRNYWAGSIHDVMRQVENIYYRNWRAACAKN
jgi:hypothetical protein